MSADGLNAHAASLAAAVDVAASATRPGHAARGPAQYRLHVALIALAFGALALGALLYAVARPHAAAFLPPGWHQPVLVSAAPLVSGVTGAAPTFLHALAMALLICAAARAVTPHGHGRCCAAVGMVEIACEFAQHPAVAAVLLGFASPVSAVNGFEGAWRSYLTRGTFDPLDLFAACAGCLAAFTLLARSTQEPLTTQGAHHVAA